MHFDVSGLEVINVQRGFQPTLFDRLFDDAPKVASEAVSLRQWSLPELKNAVARDVEALLNSRAGLHEDRYAGLSEVSRSLVSFGMTDFVGLSLASPADRNRICRTLEGAISRHEPRLRNIQVDLDLDSTAVNSLRFNIQALLHVHPVEQPVNFDAVLQPSCLQYSVGPGRLTATRR